MRNLFAISSFIGVGAVVTGAGALALKGSDTMEDVTNSVLLGDATHYCGNATLTYAGTGSGNGEIALLGANQHVAPMSRTLKALSRKAGRRVGERTERRHAPPRSSLSRSWERRVSSAVASRGRRSAS